MTDPTDDDEVTKVSDTAWFSTLDASAREAAQKLLDELDQALARMLKKRAAANEEPEATPFGHKMG